MDIKIFCSYFIAELVMIFVVLYYYKQISNIKINMNLKNIIFILIIDILLIMNNFYNYIALRFLCSILLASSIIKFIYKSTIKDTFYYTIIYSIVCIIVELLSTTFISMSIPNINALNFNLGFKIGLSIIYSIIMIIIFSNYHFIKFLKRIKEAIQLKYIAISSICILNILIIYRCYSLNNIYVLVLSIICCIFMLITIWVIIYDKLSINILTRKNENLKNSYKAYSNTIEECREFKHNIKNEMFTLKSILPQTEQERINNIIKKYNTNYEWISKIDDIPEGLQGIIYLKKIEAEKHKIKVIINTENKINIKDEDFFDLSEIIGILLDNAIEATKRLKRKIIDINIRKTKTELIISIKNNFKNSIDLNKIGKKNYSTKQEKSGIGLNYIKGIKNSNISVKFDVINDVFITKIIYRIK